MTFDRHLALAAELCDVPALQRLAVKQSSPSVVLAVRVGGTDELALDRPRPLFRQRTPTFSLYETWSFSVAGDAQTFLINRIVDGSRFSEFKPLYGKTLICGWAHIHGFPVGIIANNGTLFSESANKGAQFIQLCNSSDVPLIFLQNTTGFMVGKKYEQEGIIKNGAKMINAVSNSTVPAITIMTGSSYGAGNYAMMGRAYKPRFLFSWPNHKIAVMGGKQLAGVLDIIQREAAAKKGVEVNEQNLEIAKAMTEKQIDEQSTALYATARLWDDGIIDPRDTRTVLAMSLSASYNAPVEGTTSWGVFRH